MNAPKVKPKKTNARRANHQGKPLGSEDARTTRQSDFAAVVGAIAKRYGVKVATASVPANNPYAMSAERAEKVALQAGIITRAGNLARRFK
jgi:hypothetical protein